MDEQRRVEGGDDHLACEGVSIKPLPASIHDKLKFHT